MLTDEVIAASKRQRLADEAAAAPVPTPVRAEAKLPAVATSTPVAWMHVNSKIKNNQNKGVNFGCPKNILSYSCCI